MRRPCLDCGTPTTGNRCPTCSTGHNQQRGSAHQRGYGQAHRARAKAPEFLAATHCGTCGQPFTSRNPKTAGHTTPLRSGYSTGEIAPECARCNYGWKRTGS